jgi:hypothetical protein
MSNGLLLAYLSEFLRARSLFPCTVTNRFESHPKECLERAPHHSSLTPYLRNTTLSHPATLPLARTPSHSHAHPGRGTLFGSKILMYKKQEFGSRNTFTTPIYLTGEDEFGTRDWGLTPDDVPAGDRKAWSDTAAAYPDFVPPRDIRDHVLILDAVDKKVAFFVFFLMARVLVQSLVIDCLDPKSSCVVLVPRILYFKFIVVKCFTLSTPLGHIMLT